MGLGTIAAKGHCERMRNREGRARGALDKGGQASDEQAASVCCQRTTLRLVGHGTDRSCREGPGSIKYKRIFYRETTLCVIALAKWIRATGMIRGPAPSTQRPGILTINKCGKTTYAIALCRIKLQT